MPNDGQTPEAVRPAALVARRSASRVSEKGARLLYKLLVAGQPIIGGRGRSLLDVLGRRAFPRAEYRWHRNVWGDELWLSPAFHIDRRIIALGTYDAPLHRQFAQRLGPGTVAFDVGANIGEMALHMARCVGPAGAVFAFEPAPEIADRLAANVARNGVGAIVRVERCALSDEPGTPTLRMPDDTADNQGLGTIVSGEARGFPKQVEVVVDTLDAFVARAHIDRLDLIKADIQGAELQLLAGGEQTIRDLAPDIIMEVSPIDLRAVGKRPRDLLRVIIGYGYRVRPIERTGLGAELTADDDPAKAMNVLCVMRDR
jgi:FkbM family methyltransferase